MILFFGLFFSSVSAWSSADQSLMLPLVKSKSQMVNLEVTHLYHALKWVKWREDDLPPAGKPVKCLIVGKDDFLFAREETVVRFDGDARRDAVTRRNFGE